MKNGFKLDGKDTAILDELAKNGRVAIAELGRKVGLSQPAMSERVKRLEDRGIITGYGATIDFAALGFGLMAIVRLSTEHANIQRCLEKFRKNPNIVQVSRITGNDCFSIRVITRDARELEAIVDSIAAFGPVNTSIIMREEEFKNGCADLLWQN